MTELKINCPAKDCKFLLIAEINTEVVPKEEVGDLLDQARDRLTKSIQKHHDDGHPKEAA